MNLFDRNIENILEIFALNEHMTCNAREIINQESQFSLQIRSIRACGSNEISVQKHYFLHDEKFEKIHSSHTRYVEHCRKNHDDKYVSNIPLIDVVVQFT